MKTDAELDQIAQAIRDSCQLSDPDYARTRRRLLSSIQIDALRHAREMIPTTVQVFNMKTGDFNEAPNPALTELDELIRELELR